MNIYKLNRTNRQTGFKMTATCVECNGVFILKAGSTISPIELKGLSKRIKELRDSTKYDSNHAIVDDITFNSLYDAACFVIGTNASDKWFVKTN